LIQNSAYGTDDSHIPDILFIVYLMLMIL